ncbi:MAG TPA: GNAT family N-acetyltransferase [Microlunatus sp.]
MTGLADVAWPVCTDRLTIRPATIDDADAIWSYRRLPEVGRWIASAPADRQEFVDDFATRVGGFWVIERDGRLIGDLKLTIADGWAQREAAEEAKDREAEVGWVLHPNETGNGYATEALRAVIKIGFSELGLRRIVANCFAANDASWRLMERVGMRRESHTVKDSLHRELGWLDGYSYAILSEEWPPSQPQGAL